MPAIVDLHTTFKANLMYTRTHALYYIPRYIVMRVNREADQRAIKRDL